MQAIDIFSGAGGWTTGATMAGVRVLAAANHWRVAVDTHQENHPETRHFCQDVGLMDYRDLPVHDFLMASPACQGHSRARGKERPHHDADRATAWCVVDIAEVTRPRFIAVENVVEFQTKWVLFKPWMLALETLGYKLSVQVLNASEFGVPQERRRLIITGSLGRAIPIRSPRMAPVPMSSFIDLEAGEWSRLPFRRDGRPLSPKTMARIENTRRRYQSETFVVPYYGCSKAGRTLDRPIGTLTTKDRYALIHNGRIRMLTVDEQKAAQTFPASYQLLGNRGERVKLIGNAVPPLLAKEITSQIMAAA